MHGISHFSYFFVTQEGHSACLSSHPAWLEHYLYHELFLYNPFLKAPQLIPEGVFFTKSIKGSAYLETKKQAKTFGIEDSLSLLQKKDGKLQGFSFGLNVHEKNYTLFVNELPLLKRFCFEFQRKAEKSLEELASDPIDIRIYPNNLKNLGFGQEAPQNFGSNPRVSVHRHGPRIGPKILRESRRRQKPILQVVWVYS